MMKRNLASIIVFLGIIASFVTLDAMPARAMHKPWFEDVSETEGDCRADSLTGFDIQKYEITLNINQQSHQINGNVLATVLAESALTSLQYELSNLTVSSVLVNGTSASFTHTNGIININMNIPAGQTFTTQVFYSGIPQLSPNGYQIGMIFSANTVFTISDPDAGRYWWPCYDHPWDKALVDLHITLRSDWKVAANGIRTEIVDNGNGTSTTHWIGSNPMTTYLVCITAGPYVEINQTAGTIPIQNFVMQNQYNNALVDFARLPQMIEYFSQVFGPYPFEKYGQAVVSMSTYGAMEHQTMTTLGNYIITGTGAYENTIAHELAHQWYGDAVSFLTFKDVWLSEGFATYSEHLWTDKVLGWASAAAYVASSYHQYYMNWEAGAGPQTIYNPGFMNYFAPPSYEKAASVLHMLRLKIGNANFFQLLHDWFTTYDDGNAVTAEFEAMAEQISGQDLTQFFQQWIYGSGIPELKYSVWHRPNTTLPVFIRAKTYSNTSTMFNIEVPFRLTSGAVSDSLLVHASPDGSLNYYSTSWSADTVITANYNNWALLRSITEEKPALVECLPSNSSVLLSWNPFENTQGLSYYVYRRVLNGSPSWIDISGAVNELSYIDLTAQNGVTYQYAISAMDNLGFISAMSAPLNATPVEFSFSEDLLVVDETRDGNGANINPNDVMVDDFYAAALTPLVYQNWDVAANGFPTLSELGQYKVVLWHADDFSQNLLLDQLNILGGYLQGGGKVLISGWKTPSVLSTSFLQRFGGSATLIYDNSSCFLSASSTQYPELLVDPLKTIGTWNGMLPYIYTFAGVSDTLYTAQLGGNSQGNGNCIAFRQQNQDSSAVLVLLGMPLYFMQADGARGFLQAILPALINPTESDDLAISPLSPHLTSFPNPFAGNTSIRTYLPQAGELHLSVYNLKGQLVRNIAQTTKTAGNYSFYWDGRDDKGCQLATGIYILRLKSNGIMLQQRISLIK